MEETVRNRTTKKQAVSSACFFHDLTGNRTRVYAVRKRRNMFVTVIETVSFLSGSAALRLLINGSVDQIISCCMQWVVMAM